jgi:hypothetical protein
MDMKQKKNIRIYSYIFPMLVVAFVVFGFFEYKQKTANVLGVFDTTSGNELYVPLGTGMNAGVDWTDVKGAAAYIDSRLYGNIKKVAFEASMSVPSGNASVRLYNATDKHPVWYSEMTLVGSGPDLLISPSITLDNGNKLYQVQVKSQLGGVVNLLQSRVHVITY